MSGRGRGVGSYSDPASLPDRGRANVQARSGSLRKSATALRLLAYQNLGTSLDSRPWYYFDIKLNQMEIAMRPLATAIIVSLVGGVATAGPYSTGETEIVSCSWRIEVDKRTGTPVGEAFCRPNVVSPDELLFGWEPDWPPPDWPPPGWIPQDWVPEVPNYPSHEIHDFPFPRCEGEPWYSSTTARITPRPYILADPHWRP